MNWGFGEVLWFARATSPLAEQLRARAAAQTRVLQGWLIKSGGVEVVLAGLRDGNIRFSWPNA